MKLLPLLLLLSFRLSAQTVTTAFIILLFSCSQPSKDSKIIITKDSVVTPLNIQPSYDSWTFTGIVFASLGSYYCCDTIRTLNNTAVVKSILDTAGNLTGFEIVKVLK